MREQQLKLALAEYALDVLAKNEMIGVLQTKIRKLEKENTELNSALMQHACDTANQETPPAVDAQTPH